MEDVASKCLLRSYMIWNRHLEIQKAGKRQAANRSKQLRSPSHSPSAIHENAHAASLRRLKHQAEEPDKDSPTLESRESGMHTPMSRNSFPQIAPVV